MTDDVLRQQLAYYRARAGEYDASLQPASSPDSGPGREMARAAQALMAVGPCEQVLELAGGTGIWTETLARLGRTLTVIDGSPEMLALNRARLADPRVRYECADLFGWQPGQTYDLVFFAFWLSHVPPERLDDFLDRACRAVGPGGCLFVVDEPAGGRQISGPNQDGKYQTRALQDGRTFDIVKVYYEPGLLQQRLADRGLAPLALEVGNYFFHLAGRRAAPPSPAAPGSEA